MNGGDTGLPVRVTHLITDLMIGGAQTMLLQLLKASDHDRFQPTVICLTGDGQTAARIRDLGLEVHNVAMRPGLPGPGAVWRLYRLLRRLRPTVLQTWLYHSDFLGLILGRLVGIPAIAWNIRCAKTDARYHSGRNGMVVRLLARWSARPQAVVANSEAGRRLHEQMGYRPRRWCILPNGFDTTLFRPRDGAHTALCRELELPEDSLLIGLVARYDPLKDHATFLRAAAVCAGKVPNAHFVLIGAGVDSANAKLRRLIAEPGLDGRVHLLGERSDTPELTAGLDIATCSSSGEGFPNTIGEAMASGVPLVVTDVGDSAILLGAAGEVVPPGAPEAFADALVRLLNLAGEDRRELGLRGRRRIEECYAIDQIAAQYAALYRELAGSTAAADSGR